LPGLSSKEFQGNKETNTCLDDAGIIGGGTGVPETWEPLFDLIWQSSVMEQDDLTFKVFLYLFTHSDRNTGLVRITPKVLAGSLLRPLVKVQVALENLQSPDPNDSSGEEEGKRIVQVSPNLWRVVNRKAYANKIKSDYRREYQKEWVAKKRAEEAENAMSTAVDSVDTETRLEETRLKEKKKGRKATRSLLKDDFSADEWRTLEAIREEIGEVHEKEMHKPSQRELKDYKSILRYPLTEVRDVILWALKDVEPDAKGFCWASQVLSIPRRQKFENIRARWRSQKPSREQSEADAKAIEAAKARVKDEVNLKKRDGDASSLGDILQHKGEQHG